MERLEGRAMLTAAPSIVSINDDVGSITGSLTSGESTDDTNLVVRVSILDTGATADNTVQLFDGTNALGAAYTLRSGDIAAGYAEVSTGTLNDATTYRINATLNDDSGPIAGPTPDVTITVDTTALAPTVALSTDSGTAGDKITNDGTLSVTDTETNAVVEYSANGTSGWSAAPPTLTQGSNTVYVRQTDVAGNVSNATAFTFTYDNVAPTVSSVAITSATVIQNSTLNAGDVVSVTVTMSEDVTVTGTPQITLVVGSTNRTATYAPGTGTASLVFTYTIQAGDTDTNGISIAANRLTLNGGTIADSAGNAATLTHSAVADNASYLVDTTKPTITISSIPSALKVGGTATITFTLSEDSLDFFSDDVTAVGGTLGSFSGSGKDYTGTFTLTPSSTNPGKISVSAGNFTDVAGNLNEASDTVTISVDASPPTITITSDKTALKIGETAHLTFTLSKPALNFAIDDVISTTTNGTVADFAGSGTNYTATFTPAANVIGSATVFVAEAKFTDSVGNPNTASNQFTIAVDTQAPAAPSVPDLVSADDSGFSNTDNVTKVTQPTFTGTADQGVKVTLLAKGSNGVESKVGEGTASGDTGRWTIQAKGIGSSFSFTNGTWDVRAQATDSAGNTGLISISPELTVTIVAATVAPPTIALDSLSDSGVFNYDGVTKVTTPTFLGTAPAGTTVEVFRQLTFSTNDPELIGTVVADKDGKWLMPFGTSVVPFDDGMYDITATATDVAENVSAQATLTITIDNQSPRLLSQSSVTPGLAPVLKQANQPVASVDVNFDDEVFGLAATDLNLKVTANGSPRTIMLAGTATVLPASGVLSDDNWVVGNLDSLTGASGTYSFSLNETQLKTGKSLATDRAGNPLGYSNNSATWTTDTTAPKVTSIKANATPTPATTSSPWNTSVSSVDIVFDENVTGVDASDFTLVRDGTTVSLATASVTGSNKNWRLNNVSSLTTTDGNYTLTLKAAGSGIKDTAGTGNLLFTDAATSWRIDTTKPSATFTAVTSPRATPVDSVTLTFSEDVSGVQTGDFTLTRNSTPVPLSSLKLSPSSGSASTYVLSGLLGFTSVDGDYALSFNKDPGTKVTDAAGNQMAANPTALTWTVDTTKPTATITQPTPSLRTTAVTTVDVRFSKDVNGVGPEDFQLTRNGVVVALSGATVTANSAMSYTLNIPSPTTTPDGVYALKLMAAGSGIAATAAPENPLVADASTTWTMDATKPSVLLSVVQRIGTKATVRALFSEAVTGFDATKSSDVTVSGGTIDPARNGTLAGREYLFDVTPTPANPILPVTVTVNAGAANDAADNTSTASATLRIVTDTTKPTVVLTAPAFTNQSPFNVTATFSEPVSGLTTAGVVVTNGTATKVAGANAAWTIEVTPTGAGLVTIALAAGAAKDGSDNLNLGSNTVRVTYDNVVPTVTLASLSGNPSRANTILVAATFSENVTGVTAGDLAVTSGDAAVVGVTGSGRSYTFQVRPAADGAIGLQIQSGAATDPAGNGNDASATLSVRSDRTPPRVASLTGPVGGVVTITFTEEVRGFDIRDLLLSRNGQSLSLTGAVLNGPAGVNRTTWTLNLGQLVSIGGPYRLQIAASSAGIVDLAGNPLPDDRASANTTLIRDFTIDKTPPVATFTGVPAVTNAVVDTIALSFNEPVTGVDLADLVLSRDGVLLGRLNTLTTPTGGVSLAPANGPSATYTIGGLAPWTGSAGRYAVQLVAPVSGITDTSGNALVTSATATWTFDDTRPTATLGPVTATVSGPLSAVAVAFSEVARGVDVADFTLTRTLDGVTTTVPLAGARLVVSNAAAASFQLANLASLTGVPGNYTLTLRAAGTGIVDAAGNTLAADASATWRNVGTAVPGSLTGAFGAVAQNPSTGSVSTLPVSFSGAVTGVDAGDFRLTRTVGGSTTVVPTTGLILTGSGASWTVGGLDPLTQPAGDYVLRLVAAGSGIRTSTGIALQSDVVASWRRIATPAAPTATIALDAPVSAGAAYDAATITFSKDVKGVTLAAFVLTRGTIPVSLTGTAFAAVSPNTYRITGLAPLVATTTSYELRLVAAGSGITGTDGSTLQVDASATWTQTLASVRAAFLGIDRVNLAPVPAAKLRFSEAVRGVDVTDFELTVDRNDSLGPQVVPLRGVTISGSGTSWTVGNIGGLQAGPGKYVLRLKKSNGDILTARGATLAEDATVEWTVA